MLYDKLDHIIIDQALLVLKCIHKSFFTDPVDHTRNPGLCFMDFIQRFGCKDLLGTSGVIHMACDILFCLRSVQVWQGTIFLHVRHTRFPGYAYSVVKFHLLRFAKSVALLLEVGSGNGTCLGEVSFTLKLLVPLPDNCVSG